MNCVAQSCELEEIISKTKIMLYGNISLRFHLPSFLNMMFTVKTRYPVTQRPSTQ